MVDAMSSFFSLTIFEVFQIVIGSIGILAILVFYFGFLVSHAQGRKPEKFWQYFLGVRFLGFSILTFFYGIMYVLLACIPGIIIAQFIVPSLSKYSTILLKLIDLPNSPLPMFGFLLLAVLAFEVRRIYELRITKISVFRILDLNKDYNVTGFFILIFAVYFLSLCVIFSANTSLSLFYVLLVIIISFILLTYLASIYGHNSKTVGFVSILLKGRKNKLVKEFVRDDGDRLVIREENGQITEINTANIASFSYVESKKKIV